MRSMRGDTIIEVVLAVTIFSLIAVGALTLMNNGMAMAQRSLEITLVRQQLDAQAETLRYVSDRAREGGQYAALWADITSRADTPESILNAEECPQSSVLNGNFTLWSSAATDVSLVELYEPEPLTYAKVTELGSQGISIQMARVNNGNAYDAYVQACWYGPGSSRPATIGTIVRLYDAGA